MSNYGYKIMGMFLKKPMFFFDYGYFYDDYGELWDKLRQITEYGELRVICVESC